MEDKSIEVWKYTYLTDNYEVSNFGNIRKSSSKKLLKPYLKPNGFLGVTLSIDNVKYYKIVHRIVCKTFIKDFDNSYVYHKDNNKLNNNLNNLNYNTYKNENEIWLKCNITNDYIISNLGNIKKTEISRKHNVSYNAVHNIINKKYWSFVE